METDSMYYASILSPFGDYTYFVIDWKNFYSDFGLFYQVPLDSGTLYSTTNVIDTYVYRALIKLGNVGMSSAACLYQSVVGFVLVLTANLIVRKVSKENALF